MTAIERIKLSLRGEPFEIRRDAIATLPESILLVLFPNGLALNNGPRQLPDGTMTDEDEEVYVDFDGPCLEFILDFIDRAREDFYGTPDNPKRPYVDTTDLASFNASSPNPLFHKQAIIILREELEYFAIPPKRPAGMSLQDQSHPAVDAEGYANQALNDLKRTCGQHLIQRKSIFTALQRNVNREKNVAEQHLIDMLCMSGFGKEDEWGYRAVEPNRCCITSIALVLLKTGITFPPNSTASPSSSASSPDSNSSQAGKTSTSSHPSSPQPQVNSNQLATAQKLLLFWRKPARKCWWDSSDIESVELGNGANPLKVWARRIWTLETVLI